MNANQKNYEARRVAYFATCGTDVYPVTAEDRAGRAIYWLERGGGGVPVVFIHGGGASALVWPKIVALVAAATDRRLVVVDRPGCGLSYPHIYGGGDFRTESADFVEDVIDALGVEHVDIVANSMGGFFSLAFALRAPARVRKLILIGAPAGIDRWLPYPLRLMATRPIQWLMRWGKPMDVDGLRKLHAQILVAHAVRLDVEYLEIGSIPLPGTLDSWNSVLRCVAGFGGALPSIRVRDEVASLTVATRFVWGDRDVFAPPSSGAALASQMSDADIVVIPDAGHLPWLDEPDACAKAVLEFLQHKAVEERVA